MTRDEMKATFERWFGQWDAPSSRRADPGAAARPVDRGAAAAGGRRLCAGGGRGAGGQNQTPQPQHVEAMMAALPATAPAKPKQPRKVLVLGEGRRLRPLVDSRSPRRTIEEMGKKTGAWTTTITYDAADINEQNLKQYDAIFLASTTGAFLDDPNDAAATAARRKALLDFVRGGKGLAGIHAATDSYHQNAPIRQASRAAARRRPDRRRAWRRRGGGGGGGQAAGRRRRSSWRRGTRTATRS